MAYAMFTGKRISVFTDNPDLSEFDVLTGMLEKHDASVLLHVTNQETVKCYCCDRSRRCDCIVVDMDDPVRTLQSVKRRCVDFASVLYLRNPITDRAEAMDWSGVQRFDQTLHSINILKENPLRHNKSVLAFYESMLLKSIGLAISIHSHRQAEYDALLQAFIHSYPYASRYHIRAVVDEMGNLVSADAAGMELFEVLGRPVQSVEEFSRPTIGQLLHVRVGAEIVPLRLVSVHELQNGTTFYLETWEKIKDAKRMVDAVAKLNQIVTSATAALNGMVLPQREGVDAA